MNICNVVLPFGDGPPPYHGESNRALAAKATLVREMNGFHTIAHWRIAKNLTCLNKCTILPKGRGYMETDDILLAVKKEMDKQGFTHARLIAHQDHLSRVRTTANHFGILEYVNDAEAELDRIIIPYDSASTHPWTKYKVVSKLYQLGARIWYWYKHSKWYAKGPD